MTFYLANDGDFHTGDGACMGSYLELVVWDLTASADGTASFTVIVLHSLIHEDAEEMQWETNSKGLFKTLMGSLKTDKLNHVSTNKRNLLGFKFVSHRINYSTLPIYYR